MARIMMRILAPFPHPFSFTYVLLSFILCLPAAGATFTPTWTANATQCGEFTVQWTATGFSRAVPPFVLLIIPVNPPDSEFPNSVGLTGAKLSAPIQIALPNSSWTAASNTGTYTINALPLRSGERFLVVMDDYVGRGSGGVSDIQTVSLSSGPTDCLGPIGSDSNVLFELSTLAPAQCQTLSITTAQASTIRGFVPAGSPFSLGLPAASTGNMTTIWTVRVQAGTSFVLIYIGIDGKLASSGLMTATTGNTDGGGSCSVYPYHTTLEFSGSSTSSLPSYSASVSSEGSSGSSIPALVGVIVGIPVSLTILLFAIFCILGRKVFFRGLGSWFTASRGVRLSTVERYRNHDLSGSGGLSEDGQAKRDEGGSGGSGPGVGADEYFDEGRGGVRNETAVPILGAVFTTHQKRREARAEIELARRTSYLASSVSAGATLSSAHQTEENRRTGGSGSNLSAIDEVSGYGSGTHMTTPNLADQREQQQRSFENSEPYAGGSSRPILVDISSHEHPNTANSNPTSSPDLAVGTTTATRGARWRSSTTPNSGAAPYHLPTSLVRSPPGAAANAGESGQRMHEYPPDIREDSEPSDSSWHNDSVDTTPPGSQIPHSAAPSPLFNSGNRISSTAQSSSSPRRYGVGGSGGGRGEEDVRRGRHPHPDQLHSPTNIIWHTDAGPVITDEDDDGAGGGSGRVEEVPPTYAEVTGSNRERWRDNGGG